MALISFLRTLTSCSSASTLGVKSILHRLNEIGRQRLKPLPPAKVVRSFDLVKLHYGVHLRRIRARDVEHGADWRLHFDAPAQVRGEGERAAVGVLGKRNVSDVNRDYRQLTRLQQAVTVRSEERRVGH